MSSGVVLSVTPRAQGSTLVAVAGSFDAVLLVDDASDFSEDFSVPRYVVLSESLVPLEYVAVQNDEDSPQSITLAAPSGAVYEAGLPVVMWDPTVEAEDKRVSEFVALVRLDEQVDEAAALPAVIPHGLVPLAGAYSLVGSHVTVDLDEDDELAVQRVHARTPAVDSGYLELPYISAVLPANLTVPTAGLLTIDAWEVSEVRSFEYDPSTGIFRFLEDGMYRALFGATYESNPSGNRRIVPRKHFRDGTDQAARAVQVGANVGVSTAFEVTVPEQRFWAGEGLSFETSQSSGGDLVLLGSTGVRSRPTEVTISRVAP